MRKKRKPKRQGKKNEKKNVREIFNDKEIFISLKANLTTNFKT